MMGTKSEWGPCMSECIAWVIISIPYLLRVFSYFNEMKKKYICKVWACYVIKKIDNERQFPVFGRMRIFARMWSV